LLIVASVSDERDPLAPARNSRGVAARVARWGSIVASAKQRLPGETSEMRILVTGAGSGIGRATAAVLTSAGHEVIATARDAQALAGLNVAQPLPLDVTDAGSVPSCIAACGPIDALVNNAAINAHGALETYPIDTARACLETNTLGALRMIQAVLPGMRERRSGVIVNVSSVEGRIATPFGGLYAASKFALEAISESLHYEVGHFGIRVVIVEPGYTAPGMKQRVRPDENDEVYAGLREQWAGADQLLVGTSGRPPPEGVSEAILRAIEDPATPLRVPAGKDSELSLGLRRELDDAGFEAVMRQTLGITW
jgi:NAD(P)-dependent dehydrogenase (short-subunit alcohol dehydrogenase family)